MARSIPETCSERTRCRTAESTVSGFMLEQMLRRVIRQAGGWSGTSGRTTRQNHAACALDPTANGSLSGCHAGENISGLSGATDCWHAAASENSNSSRHRPARSPVEHDGGRCGGHRAPSLPSCAVRHRPWNLRPLRCDHCDTSRHSVAGTPPVRQDTKRGLSI